MDNQQFLGRTWFLHNRDYFDSKLIAPNIYIDESLKKDSIWGTWGNGYHERELAISTYLFTEKPDHKEGQILIIKDVVLHEMIHQYINEILKGNARFIHGPVFRDVCNDIGKKLNLGPVLTGDPVYACNNWPHNVRPKGYYLGAYERNLRRETWLCILGKLIDEDICLLCGAKGPFKSDDGKLLFLFCNNCTNKMNDDEAKSRVDEAVQKRAHKMLQGVNNGR